MHLAKMWVPQLKKQFPMYFNTLIKLFKSQDSMNHA